MIKKLFTLAFVGLLVALAVPSSRARLVTPVSDAIRNEIAPRRVDRIATQLAAHRQRGEILPQQNGLESWIRRNSAGSPADPWGNPFYLDHRRDGFVIGSMGADGVKGTTDDFTEQRRFGR